MSAKNTEVANASQAMSYELAKPASLIQLATDMQKFIKEQKLSSTIQGRQYASCEAWQFAGLSLGIIPVMREVINLSTEDEIKYGAWVDLIKADTGAKIGSGYAICSNLESTKKFFAEYAICSMAQTRAIGKAYRLMLGWLMKAAGFEPTPAEEMAEVVEEKPTPTPARPAKKADMMDGLADAIEGAVTLDELVEIWEGNKALHQLQAFKKAMDEARAKFIIPITIEQKTKILMLLDHSTIKSDEKDAMKAKLTGFDTTRAATAITKLEKTIQERTTTVTPA